MDNQNPYAPPALTEERREEIEDACPITCEACDGTGRLHDDGQDYESCGLCQERGHNIADLLTTERIAAYVDAQVRKALEEFGQSIGLEMAAHLPGAWERWGENMIYNLLAERGVEVKP